MGVLDMSRQQLQDLKEVLDCFLDHSTSAIIRNNFIEAFYKFTFDGRLQGNYRIFGAKSFRPTSNSPNMLNQPATGSIYAKPVKQCFTAEEGCIFYIVDLAALEDRVIANLSRDENKCAVFLEGVDGHCLNSYSYYTKEVEDTLPRKKEESQTEYLKRYNQAVEDGDKILKDIRQKSKPNTFLLNYGGYPKKLSHNAKISLEQATEIFENYHNVLYKAITRMREQVQQVAVEQGKIHLGLGCYMHTSDPEKEIRTLFNACSQFWSILTLLTVNKMHHLIEKAGYEKDIQIVSTIYDSIYIHMKEDASMIKWVNDTIIPILTADFIEDIIVHNEAEGEIGYNWYDTVKIPNNASLTLIQEAINNAKELV